MIALGLLIIAIGAFCQSSSYVPINKIKDWSWESYWIVQGVFAWLVLPLLGALLAVPEGHSLCELFSSNLSASGMTFFYGVLWGIGGLTFGLSMRYLGVALGQSLALGTCAALGTLLAPIFTGHAADLTSSVIIGVIVTLIGIAIKGKLDYGNSPDRTGFFKPGNLTVFLQDGNTSIQLLTRNLQAKDMLTLGIACPEAGPSSGSTSEVSITVDTLRTWSEDEWTIGSSDSDGGVSVETAYSVAQARDHAGEKGVWVCGYIVGGDLSSNKNGIRFEPPFESRTCIAIASRSSVSEKASCLSVQLTKGTFRDMLNLVDHADLLGRKVFLKGDIEASYYGIPGLKNLSDCSLK